MDDHIWNGREEEPHAAALLFHGNRPSSNSQRWIWSAAACSCLRRPQPSLDRTTTAIDNTHGIEILFCFLK
ncbi:hypothetical protein ACQJBY_041949 [Aegilops geniculata]